MQYINLTPHLIRLNSGKEYPPSGKVAHIEESIGEYDGLIRYDRLGEITGLSQPSPGTYFIVSMPVLMALKILDIEREDVICPITRGDGVVKSSDGQIYSVPGFRTF